jgi:hypothetical protein
VRSGLSDLLAYSAAGAIMRWEGKEEKKINRRREGRSERIRKE